MRLARALLLALALVVHVRVVEAAPPSEAATTDRGRLEGRIRTAGRRTPVADATLMIVAAPADARPGRPARDVLDPDEVTWIREGRTASDGSFVIEDVPLGKVRVVVLAAGHRRSESFAEVVRGDAGPLVIFVEPDELAGYRTEVASERHIEVAEPDHRLASEQARVHPGSFGDPLRAAQNLPGVARSPGGLGMIAIRGGDPRQTGVYLDGHPLPRAFHVVPIASVVPQGMIESVDLTAGNYDAAFGGHAAGLLQIHTRSGPLAGASDRAIHGEAHLDLFDFGATAAGPVGPGAVTFGFRRAHVGNVLEFADKLVLEDLDVLLPNYWDYLGRFDMPIGAHHRVTVRALGAGDSLRDVTQLSAVNPFQFLVPSRIDFSAGFHRFDLAHEYERGRLRTSISAALRLDASALTEFVSITRTARVGSLRANLSYVLSRRATLVAGVDLVDEHWRRRRARPAYLGQPATQTNSSGRDLALGAWLGVALRFEPRPGPLTIRMQVRLNVFGDGREVRMMPDPRADLRFRVHPRVEWMAAFGQYSFSQVVQSSDQTSVVEPDSLVPGGAAVLDIPIWLLTYFDPGIEGEVTQGSLLLARTLHASTGVRVELPWRLGARATAFWRETGPQARAYPIAPAIDPTLTGLATIPRARAYGLELLFDRALTRDIHGWIGYTLLRSQSESPRFGWQPAVFDQRHNLVVLISIGLPRGFRFGIRFRVVSGNPEQPVVGAQFTPTWLGTDYEPIRGEFGSRYRPVFHQLDLRLDKTWHAKRASASVYADIQNVYNLRYPELWVYTPDYRERSERIGLPIFPSLGVRVDY
ncbi:TonB-dependent receptor plug domain-containing protein [Nannocystaceae bacterium ST9]